MKEIITEKLEKINSFISKNLTIYDLAAISGSLVILSLGLLYITYNDMNQHTPISYVEHGEVLGVDSSSIVASKNGSTYYFIWCDGVGRIKEENLITFASEEEAMASGRRIAKTCEK